MWLVGLLALIVACAGDANDEAEHTSASGTLLFGGDVFLARFAHTAVDEHGYRYPFADLGPLFDESDAALVNLEAVISSLGRGVETKGERSPYLYRGRPDLVRVLSEAGVDMVTGANNHSGDYGPDAVLDQMAILEDAGIRYTGIGVDSHDARRHRLLPVGDLVVAVIGVDSTMPAFNAGSETAGTHHLDEDQADRYVDRIRQQADLARQEADLVLMTVHWGPNGADKPTPERRQLARRLIREAGLDAILGHSAHVVQGMELVDGKPVLYDAGNLMLDADGSGPTHESLLFRLTLTAGGVSDIELHPIRLYHARTERADGGTAAEIVDRFSRLSRDLSADVVVEGNRVRMPDPPAVAPGGHSVAPEDIDALPTRQDLDPPVRVSRLPDVVIPLHHTFGNQVTLLGARPLTPSVRQSHGFFLTSYWASDQVREDSDLITVRLRPLDGQGPVWDNSDTYRDHHPGDWSYPTDLWQPGELVEDHYFVRGHRDSALGPHRVYLGMAGEEVLVGEITVVPRS